ncbi:MAG: nucleolar DEAD-box protein required for synthesis of 60S ribosomal subunit, partial [Pleopsidium flavum]
MAVLQHDRLETDNDFVLTISDNDAGLSNSEEETPQVVRTDKNRKKRKRDVEEPRDEDSTNHNKDSKAKKAKRVLAKVTPEIKSGNEDDQSWAAIGENDGAMDSDFEFQIGETDTGIVEDFDGWGTSTTSQGRSTGGDKRAVDVDDIIARRKGRAAQEPTINGSNGDHAEIDQHIEVNEEEVAIDSLGSSAFDEEGDELLAADGFGMGATGSDEDGESSVNLFENGSEDEESMGEQSEVESVASPVAHPDDIAATLSSDDEKDDPAELARRKAFFAPEEA